MIFKSIRFLKWKILQLLPSSIKFALIRSSIEINNEALSEYVFKIATSKDEIEQGFRLLYLSYYKDGLIKQNTSELRITKYHLLPTSSMIIAKKGHEVVATVTHIMDSSFGLPCEVEQDLSELRQNSLSIAEISALAIKEGYRRNHSLLFGLTRYLYTYSTRNCGVQHWVICIRNRVADYYKSIFFFTPLHKKSFKYNFVNGVEAACLVADLKALVDLFKNYYGDLPKRKNLYDFYLDPDRENVEIWPEFIFKTSTIPVYTVEMLNYFFKHKLPILQELSVKEKNELLNAYHEEDYEKFLDLESAQFVNRRKDPRRVVSLKGFMMIANGLLNQVIHVTVVNISRGGLLIHSIQNLTELGDFDLNVEIVLNQTICIKIKVIKALRDDKYACSLTEKENPAWSQFIDAIERHLQEFNQDYR